MNRKEILNIVEKCTIPDSCDKVEFTESNYSWIIYGDHYAFKIIKPVRDENVDFSTPAQRKHICEKELQYNAALADKIYDKIIAVRKLENENNDNGENEVIDYALVMKRFDHYQRLDEALQNGTVTQEIIDKVARKMARFHEHAKIVRPVFDPDIFLQPVLNLEEKFGFIEKEHGEHAMLTVFEGIQSLKDFIHNNATLFEDRIIMGHFRDVHGNLHLENILVNDDPLIYNRIVINDHVRQKDMLDDMALLVMELDFHGKGIMGNECYQSYLHGMKMVSDSIINRLFTFYKLYHALIHMNKLFDECRDTNNKEKRQISSQQIFRNNELLTSYNERLS